MTRSNTGGRTTRDILHKIFGSLCFYCGKKPGNTTDHFIPIKKGGKRLAKNKVPACRQCNEAKGDKMPTEEQIAKFNSYQD